MSTALPLLVDPQVLAPVLPGNGDLLVVDICQPRTWRQAHLPGARHLDPVDILGDDPRLPGLLPGSERLQELLGSIGYRADAHIVIYDDEGGGWAGRFAWLLDSIGHGNWSCLDGGLIAWYREGLPLARDIDVVEPTQVRVQVDEQWTASSDELLQELDDPTLAIWDARSAEEYAGLRTGSMRAGHIPGARHLDWDALKDPERNYRLQEPQRLRDLLTQRGILPEQRIVTYCQSHHRSGLSYLAARSLGQPVRAYAGAWSEWGNRHDLPIGTSQP